jgi:hypothetical protein
MKPIWYFVGILLMMMGLIIVGEGLRLLSSPDARQTILSNTHPDIWWGGLMTAVGSLFMMSNRKKRVE